MNNRSQHITQCQSIFNNILRCDVRKESASTFIRAVFESVECDDIRDLSKERNEYSAFLSRNGDDARMALYRIMTYKETLEDEKRAVQAKLHYHFLHKPKFVSNLSYFDWVHYHIAFC